MLDYTALATLAEVLRRGSFEQAATALNLTPSAISQRIRALEDRLGAVLVHRGPPATGTELGLRLMRHADQVAALEQELPLANTTPQPAHLRIAVNADSLASWFLPTLTALPQIQFELVIDDQDHAIDWLRRGEVSAALCSEPKPVTGCDCVALGKMRYLATASPDFVARHFAEGIHADTLSRAPALSFNLKDQLQISWVRQVAGRHVRLSSHQIPSSTGFIEAAELGLGWGMNPAVLAAAAIDAGRLTELLPGQPLDVPLYWQSLRSMAGPLAPLTAAVRARAAQLLSC